MSQADEDLKEVKSVIRGLIISSASAITIRQLESDYRKQEGTTIPYLRHQYPSIEAFLRSIPDTVHLREPAYGCPSNMIIVEPVQSKKSLHVEKMVTRQRNTTLRGPKRTSAVSGQYVKIDTSKLNGMAPRFIPLALRTSLSRVFQRYSSTGLPLSSLGRELSYDLSMAGLVEGGKSGWLSTFAFDSVKDVIDTFIDQGLIKIASRSGQDWVLSSTKNELGVQTSEEFNCSTKKSANSPRYDNCRAVASPRTSPEGGIMPAGSEDFSDDGNMYSDSEEVGELVSDQMKKNFRTLLARHPNGLWCASLPQEYKLLTGCELNVRQMGFVSVVDMASRLKDVFISTRPDSNSDWLLFDSKSNAMWNSSAAPVGRGNQMPVLPSKFVRNIEALLLDYPKGIEKAKLLQAYKDKYNEDFPMIDFGFENLIALLSHLANRKVVHLKFAGNISMVCRPCNYTVNGNMFLDLKKDNDFINALYPLDIVGPNEEIPVQPLPEGLTPGCSLDIQVTEICTPSKFWFQLYGTDMHADFDGMMDEMQVFYDSGGPATHRMPDATIIIGQYCAANYPPDQPEVAEWHRARISSLPSLSEVEVFYPDYGSTAKCRRSEIRFLNKRFAKYPLQALSGCLTNIRPVGYGLWKKIRDSSSGKLSKMKPTWPSESGHYFLKLITNKPSVAVISHIRELDNRLSIGLTDTSKDIDEHINDMLVNKKLAEFGEMSDDEDFMSQYPSDKEEEELPGGDGSYVNTQFTNDHHSPLSQPATQAATSPISPRRPVLSDSAYLSHTIDRMSPTGASHPLLSPSHVASQKKTFEEEIEEYLQKQALKDKKMEEEHERLKGILEKRKLEEQRKLEELRMLEEEKRLAEQRKLEYRIMEEQRELEERRAIELKAMEEKANQDSLLRYELQKLQIQQYLLDLQQQQYQMQLLLLASQNGMVPTMPQVLPQVLSPMLPQVLPPILPQVMPQIVRSQVTQPGPPPGLINRLPPPVNSQADLAQFLVKAMQSNSFLPSVSNPSTNLPTFENAPLIGGTGYPGWNNTGPGYGNASMFDAGGGSTAKTGVLSPPGFENMPHAVTPSNSPNIPSVLPNASPRSNSDSLVHNVTPSDQVPNISLPGVNVNPISNGLENRVTSPAQDLRIPSEVPSTSHSLVPNDVVNHAKSIPLVKLNSQHEILKEPECNVQINTHKGQYTTVPQSNSPSDNGLKDENPDKSVHFLSSIAKVGFHEDSSNKNSAEIFSESITNLESMIGSCKITPHCKQNSSDGTQDDTSQKHLKPEDKYEESCLLEKWTVKIETPISGDENPDIVGGFLNGKAVNVIKVDGAKYVMTEEILALFFNNLPVHVALRIAKLRPNGNKIKSISLDPRKDRAMCRKISSLNVIEVNPYGSDVHLTSVDSIQFLCGALASPA